MVTIALFVAIGGSFVYASIALEDARKTSSLQTKSTISHTGVFNNFRHDVSTAKAVRLDESGTVLDIAKADGVCSRWTIGSGTVETPGNVLRATTQDRIPDNFVGSEIANDVESGSFSVDSNLVSISLNFVEADKLNESVRLNLAGTDESECW